MLKHATGMFLNARTILGLPGKIGNANTSPNRKVGAFFCRKVSTGHFLNGGTIRTQSLNRTVGAFSLRVSGQRIVSSIKK